MADEQTKFNNNADLGFWQLVGLLFQGTFNTILFIYVLVQIILARHPGHEMFPGGWIAALALLYAAPFVTLTGLCGPLADRFGKRFVIMASKSGEAIIAALVGVFLFLYSRNPSTLWFSCLFVAFVLWAVQNAFYYTSQFGILPELLPADRLTWANGYLHAAIFSAVVLGILFGGVLFGAFAPERLEWIAVVMTALSAVGLYLASRIRRTPPATPKKKIKLNHFPLVFEYSRIILADRVLLVSLLGIAFFWTLMAITMINLPRWSQVGLGLSAPNPSGLTAILRPLGIMIAPLALGVSLGAILVGAVCKRGVELGLAMLGGFGLAIFSLAPAWSVGGDATPFTRGVMVLSLMLMGAAGGFFSVPLNALFQERIGPEVRGGISAAMNFLIFLGLIFGLFTYYLMLGPFGLSPANIFLVGALMSFMATLYLITVLPEALVGLISTLVTRVLYRIRFHGRENVPEEGPAILVSNHVSILDALLIGALTHRPIRFIVWQQMMDNPILGIFLRTMKAIPVASDARPRALIKSLSRASDALNDGELVCVFTEGNLTRAGLPMPMQRGFKYVLDRAPAPIIPVYLEGVWGTIFSYERKRYRWSWPRRLRYPVQIAVGKALPRDASQFEMRQSVQALSADCALAKKEWMKPIHHRFIANARRKGSHFCIADAMTEPNNFRTVLIRAIVLARRLRKTWGDQKMVGIYLPPSVGGAIVNAAATLSGRTAVNLNYTAGREVLEHCVAQCDLKTVITSKLFIKKLGAEPPPGAVYIDDFRFKPSVFEKVGGLLSALFFPPRLLESYCGAVEHPTPDSLLTVIFSSGSTGVPKGVMLTHFNVASNVESVERSISLWPDDRLIGFLPFFHSFGYTIMLWAQMSMRFSVIHHPNPLEAKQIADLCEKYGITVMVATPTFLQNFTRRVDAEKFKTLEFVLTGAEKLPRRLAEAFEEKFGVEVHEGYGTTECAPVVSANVDDYRTRDFHFVGHKRGSVGRPLPGIVVEIRDVETGERRGANESGLINVRGANIMRGYLDMEEKTARVLRDGWYETGDVGILDEQGFLHITDRLNRFSKIGGEMVPHMRIEEELHKAIGATDLTFAVTSVPDETRGERLAVLHTCDSEQIRGIRDKLTEAGLPNLWIPRESMFFKIEELPVLGTGKLDLAGVKRTAAERFGDGREQEAPASSEEK